MNLYIIIFAQPGVGSVAVAVRQGTSLQPRKAHPVEAQSEHNVENHGHGSNSHHGIVLDLEISRLDPLDGQVGEYAGDVEYDHNCGKSAEGFRAVKAECHVLSRPFLTEPDNKKADAKTAKVGKHMSSVRHDGQAAGIVSTQQLTKHEQEAEDAGDQEALLGLLP